MIELPKKRQDLRKRNNYFYQALNNSAVTYNPTVERPSVNQLYATMPLNEKQKEYVKVAAKHLKATGGP